MTDTPEIARIRAAIAGNAAESGFIGYPEALRIAIAHIDAQAADLARISAELGLPPTIGPAPGYLSVLMESAKAQAAEIERLAEYNQTRTDELSASVAQCVGQHTEIKLLTGIIAECREALPAPTQGSVAEPYWAGAMCAPEGVPAYIKAAFDARAAAIEGLNITPNMLAIKQIIDEKNSALGMCQTLEELICDKDEEIERLRVDAAQMRETLASIVNADPRKWEELACQPTEFERWAKSRANHAIIKSDAAMKEQP